MKRERIFSSLPFTLFFSPLAIYASLLDAARYSPYSQIFSRPLFSFHPPPPLLDIFSLLGLARAQTFTTQDLGCYDGVVFSTTLVFSPPFLIPPKTPLLISTPPYFSFPRGIKKALTCLAFIYRREFFQLPLLRPLSLLRCESR